MSLDAVPTLDQLADDPRLVRGLSRTVLEDLSMKAVMALTTLTVATRLAEAEAETGNGEPDRMLSCAELAELMGRKVAYVYDHKADWPFTVQEPGCRPMFSLAGYQKWLAERDGRGYSSPRAKARKGGHHGQG